ncbi:MAG: hypothetical protein IJK64_10840 [Clostridia bacterium]|nr:hypothetical protein [Clostridia bacterium]
MDDYEEGYVRSVEKEVDEIRAAALRLVQTIRPEIEAVIDRRTLDDYSEKIWDYPGKWYLYFRLPAGFRSREELIAAIARETLAYFSKKS